MVIKWWVFFLAITWSKCGGANKNRQYVMYVRLGAQVVQEYQGRPKQWGARIKRRKGMGSFDVWESTMRRDRSPRGREGAARPAGAIRGEGEGGAGGGLGGRAQRGPRRGGGGGGGPWNDGTAVGGKYLKAWEENS